MQTIKEVAIILVNWSQKKLTEECLQILLNIDNKKFDIILIDNDSKDDSVSFFKSKYPEITLIVNAENLGFTGGNNVGMRHAVNLGYKYIYLLNNDTEVEVNFINEVLNVAGLDSRIGIVGSSVFYFEPSNVIWFSGGHANWLTGDMYDRRAGKIIDVDKSVAEEVDEVAGAGMLIKSEVLSEIGFLDERFFIYFEETDLCARAKRNNWKVVWCPKSIVWHKVSSSFGEASPIMIYLMTRNRWLFMKKNSPKFKMFVLYFISKSVRDISRFIITKKFILSKAILYGVFDALFGLYGKGRINIFKKE
jgi:GT2 family glycosyltransferase